MVYLCIIRAVADEGVATAHVNIDDTTRIRSIFSATLPSHSLIPSAKARALNRKTRPIRLSARLAT
jgi:hypothetical protein